MTIDASRHSAKTSPFASRVLPQAARADAQTDPVAVMDEQAFAELYQRYRRPFLSIAAARVGPDAALDVVHEVFTVVWSKRREAPESSEWAPWCFGILRNKVRQEVQRSVRKHHDNRFIEDHGQGGLSSSRVSDVAETVAETLAAQESWEALSRDDRELLLLVVSTDLPGAELAQLLEISHVAYRRRVSRLRDRIAARKVRASNS